MSDTPRTSEEWRRIQRLPDGRYSSQVTYEDLAHGMCNFAKQLERELAEARKEISDLQGDVEAWKRETMIANARLRGEKHPDDNGAISTKEIIPKLQRELSEVTKQRDALVEALDNCLGGYDVPSEIAVMTQEDYAFAKSALSAVKGGGK